jgi:hypothetical protein
VNGSLDRLGAEQLPGVWHCHQPALPRDAESLGEVLRCPDPLVVGQTEPDDAAVGEPYGKARLRLGFPRRSGAVRRDDEPNPDTRHLLRFRSAGAEHLHRRDEVAEPGGVTARRDLQLQPTRAVGRLVLRNLAKQPLDVGLGAQHAAGQVIEPLEPRPAQHAPVVCVILDQPLR